MKISDSTLNDELIKKILNPDPLEGEDILIEDSSGETIGVIIQPKAYQFLLRKIEEIENANDSKEFEKYEGNGSSLDDLME